MTSPVLTALVLMAVAAVVIAACSGGERPEHTGTTEGTRAVIDDDPVEPSPLIPLPMTTVWGEGHLHPSASGAWPEPAVRIDPDATDLGQEGYRLTVDADGVDIVAGGEAGAFYAGVTLEQLVQPAGAGLPARLPFVAIVDRPRFEWRGFMLDVARHFFDVDVVKAQIDTISRYKMNRLHLHLTDDQGWRIQIDAWPALTRTGASIDYDGDGPGGFFTAEDYADITEYAAQRFVTVVPEIDVPGHVNAALASHPELNADGIATELRGEVPFGQSALAIESPATAGFIADVFSEVAAMTPGDYVHLGGDEALALGEAEYAELAALAADAVISSGKTPIGWEETATADLPRSLIVQYWRQADLARRAVDAGHALIVSPADRAYLDQKYDEHTPVGVAWAGLVDVETAYDWDPVDEGLTDGQVLGVEAPLWTETIGTREELELMAYPRLLGYAEIGWTPREARDWSGYRERLAAHGPRLTDLGVGFFASGHVDWER